MGQIGMTGMRRIPDCEEGGEKTRLTGMFLGFVVHASISSGSWQSSWCQMT
ncbi:MULTISPECIES: hypothetical protein [unclassified Mesorhizobium]|uniref:hypothetical protein n=1 Tax=unclassified Mesorhizobium TaxID=325217 RepID=UPI0015969F13|nr:MULTISPECIES: hypothetical protein [unclassified Mesorhizobium]